MARLVYLLSPAKTLDLSAPALRLCSQPALLEDAHELVKQLQKLSQVKIKSLLGVSDALAKLNYDRYQSFEFVKKESKALEPSAMFKQAALAFNGPAYQGLAAAELSESDLAYAQNHLVILCGLYGTLRPLDLIQPYRLEMGQKFANERGSDLYAFWGSTISKQLNAHFASLDSDAVGGEKIVVNVASQEYFKSVRQDALDSDVRVVDCVFQDDGKIKSVYAKRARGLMCRFLIERRVDSLDGVREFNLEGYEYSPRASNDSTLVFNRSGDATNWKQTAEAKEPAATATKAKKPRSSPAKPKTVKEEVVKEQDEGETTSSLRRSTRKKRKTTA